MQFPQPNTLGNIEPEGGAAGSQLPTQPASMYPRDFSSPDRDEFLSLLNPDGDRKRNMGLVAGALVAGIGLGWAGGFIWSSSANMAALDPITQKETASRRIPETKAAGKTEGTRKSTSTSGLQAPQGGSAVSAAGASIVAKPLVASPGGAHVSADPSSTASSAFQANISAPGALVAVREPMVAAPETRPTTIEGWTVLDVRGGTVVLEGPDGVRMATRGETVPGIGRIDSIVRWGNRWIVATANGLIATP